MGKIVKKFQESESMVDVKKSVRARAERSTENIALVRNNVAENTIIELHLSTATQELNWPNRATNQD